MIHLPDILILKFQDIVPFFELLGAFLMILHVDHI